MLNLFGFLNHPTGEQLNFSKFLIFSVFCVRQLTDLWFQLLFLGLMNLDASSLSWRIGDCLAVNPASSPLRRSRDVRYLGIVFFIKASSS